jgi:hypothetical protein
MISHDRSVLIQDDGVLALANCQDWQYKLMIVSKDHHIVAMCLQKSQPASETLGSVHDSP